MIVLLRHLFVLHMRVCPFPLPEMVAKIDCVLRFWLLC